MPLSVVSIDEVTPRGGVPGTAVVVTGVGFGVDTGQVIFDPLGTPATATVTLWQDDRIEFTTPALLSSQRNKHLVVQVIRDDEADHTTFVWWSVSDPVGDNGIDYQLPAFEAGSLMQDVDDPQVAQAADYNRLLDRAGLADDARLDVLEARPTLPALTGRRYTVLQESPIGARSMGLLPTHALVGGYYGAVADTTARDAIPGDVRAIGLLVWVIADEKTYQLRGGTDNSNWVEYATAGGGGGGSETVDVYTNNFVDEETEFTLSATPINLNAVKFIVNGVVYTANSGRFTIGGPGNTIITWLDSFKLLVAVHTVEAHYPA
jgi:hypothetical protein